jgi:hypothetical protein
MATDHVIPVTEASIRALIPLRDGLPGTGIPMLDPEAFERVSDKRCVLDIARELGVAVPRQVVLESADALGDVYPSDWPAFPVFVKPSRSVARPDASGARLATPAARRLETYEELEALLKQFPTGAFPLLVQGEIRGEGAGVFLLIDRGRTLAAFAHRRVREKPPSGGVSVCRETGELLPELLAMSLALLERLEWRGPAMVEYRVDETSGVPVLMEVNGRFWGSLQLAIDAGVDFPALVVDHVEGRPIPDVEAPWRNVRLRWLWGEIDHVWARLRGGGRGGGGRWSPVDGMRAAVEVLAVSLRDRTEVLRPSDIGPFMRESGARLVGGVRRLTGASTRGAERLSHAVIDRSADRGEPG